MSTFDQIVPEITEIFYGLGDALNDIKPIYINRDLYGRVRLIIDSKFKDQFEIAPLNSLSDSICQKLGKHGVSAPHLILFEEDLESIATDTTILPLEGLPDVFLLDRLATESRWASIAPESSGAPRIVYFSIKGGVGRSTAMAASAWALAQSGKKVLVLDMDLESPGLSSALLPDDRRPQFGITDWLVEDLVDNGDAVFNQLIASSTLSRDGDIYVVPAYGRDAGEYVSKLGRVWMPKQNGNARENWSQRLARLINQLESTINPDVILIDSRSGIDEVSSSCVTDLGATLVLLFAIDGEQTWKGYQLLFDYWRRSGVAEDIRERLQLVGAMVPELGAKEYVDSLREQGCELFTEGLYDEVPSGESLANYWNFGEMDESAPHYPWAIRWHRGFAALKSLHQRFSEIDQDEVNSIYGELINGLNKVTINDNTNA